MKSWETERVVAPFFVTRDLKERIVEGWWCCVTGKDKERGCNKWDKTASYENGVSVGGSNKCES